MTKTHPRRAHSQRLKYAGLASASLVCASLVYAQEAEEEAPLAGLFATVDIVNSLIADERNTRLGSDVALNVTSQSRNTRLSFLLGGGVDLRFDTTDITFERPTTRLEYVWDNGDTELSTLVRFRRAPVFGLVPTDTAGTGPGVITLVDSNGNLQTQNDFDDVDLVRDDGEREDLRYGVALEMFKQSSVGAGFEYAYNGRRFFDTADPDVFDTDNTDVRGFIRFTFNPRADARITYEMLDYEAFGAGETQRETTRLGADLTWRLTPILRFNLGVGNAEVDTEVNDTAGGRVRTLQDGSEFDFTVAYDRPNGRYTFSTSRGITSTGALDEYSFGRLITFKNGQLSANIGISEFESGESTPTYSVAYSRDTRRGSFDISARQSAGLSADNDDVTFTSLSASYTESISQSASLTFAATYSASDLVDFDTGDTDRSEFGVTYRQDLTREWDFAAGFSYSASNETGADSTDNNTLFFNLERSFAVRP